MFKNKGFKIGQLINLIPRDAYALCQEEAILVDVRENFMIGYKKFDVKQTVYCPASIIKECYLNLPDNVPLVLADASGLHSKEAALFLLEKGFKNISNLAGGLVEWERDDLPLKKNDSEQMNGACPCQLRPKKINKK